MIHGGLHTYLFDTLHISLTVVYWMCTGVLHLQSDNGMLNVEPCVTPSLIHDYVLSLLV